jgi:tripartite-type tricarboxylate transporter receptor subunit TctC
MVRMAAMICIGLAAAASVATAVAADYPGKPIRLVVGFGAGGPTDIPARFIAEKLGERLGQRVLVENKPAAAGMIAARDVLSQPKDGYNLLLCTHFEAINTAVYKNAGFKLSEIAPISLIAKYYYGLALSSSIPADDFASFVQYAKAHPGEVSYAVIGAGSAQEPDSIPGRTAGGAGTDRRAGRLLRLADPRRRAAI